MRPSVIFGADDNFFNKFAKLARIMPVLPLIGGGQTKFQPVYVGDVADAVVIAALEPAAAGKIFELAGPETLSVPRDLRNAVSLYGAFKAIDQFALGRCENAGLFHGDAAVALIDAGPGGIAENRLRDCE
jgi:nucleoside-diphosphate-sugar epimerase